MKIEVSIDVTNVVHVEALNAFTKALGGHNPAHSQIIGEVTLIPTALLNEIEEPTALLKEAQAETPKKSRTKKAEEKPVEEKPVEEKPVEEKPVEEKPAGEKPVEEKPVEETPSDAGPKESKLTLEEVRALAAQLCSEDEDNRPLILNKVSELSNGETKKLPQLSPEHFPALMNYLKTLQNG